MTTQHNLTPWFPGDVKPVRPGVYETDARGSRLRCFQHWNGRFWGMACKTLDGAELYADDSSNYQDDKWRGLASPVTDEQTDDSTGIAEVSE